MMKKREATDIKTYFTFAAFVAWVIVVGPAIVRAQAGNTINACYNKTNGSLRRVNSAADCTNAEILISWNIQGQKGDKGDTGLPGAPGAKGDKGDPGAQGIQGAAGTNGNSIRQSTQPFGSVNGDNCQSGSGHAFEIIDGSGNVIAGTRVVVCDGTQGNPGPQGLKGDPGESVEGLAVPPGADCAYGGVMYASASGKNFVCNGAPGAKGDPGAQGPKGDPGAGVNSLFGDGSDGDVTISRDTMLTRDMYYNNLTLERGVVLNPNGYRIFVRGTLSFELGSSIARNGNDGTETSGGQPLAPGTIGGGGGIGPAGKLGDVTNSLGGAGGCVVYPVDPGWKRGGLAGLPAIDDGGPNVLRSAVAAITGRSLSGARIWGGAGGAFDNYSGYPGGGGGVVVIVASVVIGTGSITANGGPAPGYAGGGGGGVVVVVSTVAQPAGITLSAAGGTSRGQVGCEIGSPGTTMWLIN